MGERLRGKVAVVTGASRGQGAAEARLFAAEGATVILADREDAAGKALAEDLVAHGLAAEYRHLDVAQEAEWTTVVSAIVAEHGHLDVLVNNAGIGHGVRLMEATLEDWNRVLQVNLTGVFLGIRAAVEPMRAAGGGSIVNIGSLAALTGYIGGAYTPSKWGVRGLTKAAAIELAGDGIRVNAIHPGLVDTPMLRSERHKEVMTRFTPLGFAAVPEDIASAALYLASDESRFVTGADLSVDGGFTAGAGARAVAIEAGTLPI